MSPAARQWVVRLAQGAILAAALWYAWRSLGGRWGTLRTAAGDLHVDWPLATASALLVLATHAALAQAWRTLVTAWGGRLGFWSAARITSVSKLGLYLPGKVWSVAALGIMAQRAGVSPVAATGSAILGTLVNLAAGFAVVLLTGTRALAVLAPGATARTTALVLAGAATVGLVALPWLLPSAARFALRLARREVPLPALDARRLWAVVTINALAWFGYGGAFLLLARAVLPDAALATLSAGSWSGATAVFTASYLAGYLVLVAPGGLGVREGAMAAVLPALGLATAPEAWILALASRLWLAALELLPGLLFLARDALARSPSTTPDAPS